MSRSFKKAMITISKKLRINAYKALRKRVRSKLSKIDPENISDSDLIDIEADTRDMGLEEYGTKIDLEFEDLDELADPDDTIDWEEERKRERRK